MKITTTNSVFFENKKIKTKKEEIFFKKKLRKKSKKMTRLRTFQLILLVCSWNVVNSKSNSQSNGNSTKGVIRHQQTFETKLNHLVVDVVGNRVSERLFFLMYIFFLSFSDFLSLHRHDDEWDLLYIMASHLGISVCMHKYELKVSWVGKLL